MQTVNLPIQHWSHSWWPYIYLLETKITDFILMYCSLLALTFFRLDKYYTYITMQKRFSCVK